MKKNFIKAAFVAAFASIAGYGVYTSQQKVEMSDLAKANVEALALGESEDVYCCGNYGICMKVMDMNGNIIEIKGIKFTAPCPQLS